MTNSVNRIHLWVQQTSSGPHLFVQHQVRLWRDKEKEDVALRWPQEVGNQHRSEGSKDTLGPGDMVESGSSWVPTFFLGSFFNALIFLQLKRMQAEVWWWLDFFCLFFFFCKDFQSICGPLGFSSLGRAPLGAGDAESVVSAVYCDPSIDSFIFHYYFRKTWLGNRFWLCFSSFVSFGVLKISITSFYKIVHPLDVLYALFKANIFLWFFFNVLFFP